MPDVERVKIDPQQQALVKYEAILGKIEVKRSLQVDIPVLKNLRIHIGAVVE